MTHPSMSLSPHTFSDADLNNRNSSTPQTSTQEITLNPTECARRVLAVYIRNKSNDPYYPKEEGIELIHILKSHLKLLDSQDKDDEATRLRVMETLDRQLFSSAFQSSKSKFYAVFRPSYMYNQKEVNFSELVLKVLEAMELTLQVKLSNSNH